MSSTTEQQKLLHSQSVWKIYFGAVLQDIREPNWREEEEEGEWKKKYSKHEFYAWCEVEWDTVGLPQTPGISVTDEEIIKRWCSENGYQIRDDGVYVWDLKEEDSDSEEEEEENTCWGNNKCDRDEFGCCIVCCECRECIKRIKEEHAALEEEE